MRFDAELHNLSDCSCLAHNADCFTWIVLAHHRHRPSVPPACEHTTMYKYARLLMSFLTTLSHNTCVHIQAPCLRSGWSTMLVNWEDQVQQPAASPPACEACSTCTQLTLTLCMRAVPADAAHAAGQQNLIGMPVLCLLVALSCCCSRRWPDHSRSCGCSVPQAGHCSSSRP